MRDSWHCYAARDISDGRETGRNGWHEGMGKQTSKDNVLQGNGRLSRTFFWWHVIGKRLGHTALMNGALSVLCHKEKAVALLRPARRGVLHRRGGP
jgi:hypothetical protein